LTGRARSRDHLRAIVTLGVGIAAALAALALASGCGSSRGGGDPSACKNESRGLPKLTWAIPTPTPRGVVILLPGGGWQPNPTGYRTMVAYGKAIQAGGVATVAVEYGAGAAGLRQIQGVYDRARRCFPDAPVCALGDSAGGHLALMLATREPDLACVIARAAPTDLTTLAGQGAEQTNQYAIDAFGAGSLARFSPAKRAGDIDAPVLLVMAENDPLVPVAQGEELARALPGARLMVMPPGPVPFVHGFGVTQSSAERADRREQAFLGRAASGS
jgi:acetyl esterase/lipase